MGLFSNTQRQQCFSVEITSDAIAEDTENFSLNLTLQPGEVLRQVINNPAVAEITINDNDRKSSSDVPQPHKPSHGATMWLSFSVVYRSDTWD